MWTVNYLQIKFFLKKNDNETTSWRLCVSIDIRSKGVVNKGGRKQRKWNVAIRGYDAIQTIRPI